MKRCMIVFLLLTGMQIQAIQAQKTEVLTNRMIVDLYKAGLGNETIVSKIETSECKFDVSTNGMLLLAKQKLPDNIIKAMVEKEGGRNNTGLTNHLVPKETQGQSSRMPVINLINHVHYFDKGLPVPLEKLLGESKSKRKGLGYGGVEMKIEIPAETSSVKLNPEVADTFLINSGGMVPNLVLFKLKTEKNKRIGVIGKLTVSGPQSSEDAIAVAISKMGDNLYLLTPGKSLGKGEYFFTAKPDINQSMSASDVYAFSVQ